MMISYCIFFFKQKTAYELRISDWSSDVCSSDLCSPCPIPAHTREKAGRARRCSVSRPTREVRSGVFPHGQSDGAVLPGVTTLETLDKLKSRPGRSEERRVGKECVSTCSSRWSPYLSKKKKHHDREQTYTN